MSIKLEEAIDLATQEELLYTTKAANAIKTTSTSTK